MIRPVGNVHWTIQPASAELSVGDILLPTTVLPALNVVQLRKIGEEYAIAAIVVGDGAKALIERAPIGSVALLVESVSALSGFAKARPIEDCRVCGFPTMHTERCDACAGSIAK